MWKILFSNSDIEKKLKILLKEPTKEPNLSTDIEIVGFDQNNLRFIDNLLKWKEYNIDIILDYLIKKI